MSTKASSRLFGYARVSTGQQDLKLQIDALKAAGVEKPHLFSDKISGSREARPGLDACLQKLKMGDTLLVWRLDRLGRSIRHLIDLVEDLRQRGVGFKSICDGAIDTTTASGELIFNVFASLAPVRAPLDSRAHQGWTNGSTCPRTNGWASAYARQRSTGSDRQEDARRQINVGGGYLPDAADFKTDLISVRGVELRRAPRLLQ